MKIYIIHFNGYNPVGAVALSRAKNPEQAFVNFQQKLKEHYPDLIDENLLREDVIIVEFDTDVEILLDGEY